MSFEQRQEFIEDFTACGGLPPSEDDLQQINLELDTALREPL